MTGSRTTSSYRGERPRGRIPITVAFSTLLLVGVSGCAVATPLCDEGASLAESGRLGLATERYAQASQRGEGDCADAGLSSAGDRYADAHVNAVRGRSAEDIRDVEAATAAYRAALAFDVDNAAAHDGLARLGQPQPTFAPLQPAPPQPVPPAPAPAPGSQDGVVLALSIAAVALLCIALGLLSLLVARSWRGSASSAAPGESTRRPVSEVAEAARWKDALDVQTATIVTKLGTLHGALIDMDARLAPRFEWLESVLCELDPDRERGRTSNGTTLLGAINGATARLERASVGSDERLASIERHLDEILDRLDDAGVEPAGRTQAPGSVPAPRQRP